MTSSKWTRRVLILCALLGAAEAAYLLGEAVTSHAAVAHPCRTQGTPPFTAPDNRCTPGAVVRKSRADVCDGSTVRPSLATTERRVILRNYGFSVFTGATGELDHRVPLVYGGTTDRRNVWPEREVAGFNPKDRLEAVILRRVCKRLPHPMSVRTAVRVFLTDWRPAYDYYVLGRRPA
jgi:hypothetical protein